MAKDIPQKINELKSIGFYGEHSFMNAGPDAFVEIFGNGIDAVSFLSVKNVKDFNFLTQNLYSKDKRITVDFTLSTFQDKLCDLLRTLYKENRDASINDWNVFISNLIAFPDNSVKILTPIFGVEMTTPTISFGDFTIYQTLLAEDFLKMEFPLSSNLIEKNFKFSNDYIIGVNVKAKDLKKCEELATKAFNSFENISNFITASFHKTRRIGIFNYSDSKRIVSFITSQTIVKKSRTILDNFETVQIDHSTYKSEENGDDKIWKLITSPKNELERKLMDSIEWCGKALVESDDSKALLQYIICIESLLQYDEAKFIAPSIVSQLCDMIAFLLGENYKERVSYSTHLRDLYKIRSSITHSGKGKVTSSSLHTAHVLCYKTIRKIITTEPYKSFKTKKDLCEYLLNLKYGKPNTEDEDTEKA